VVEVVVYGCRAVKTRYCHGGSNPTKGADAQG
jgi:hypothetical protein